MLRVFGYLRSYKKAMNVFDIREFTTETLDNISNGWKELYPNAYEELPPDMPVPKKKPLSMTAIYDASHAPCLITRRSVTGIVLLLNNFILRCTSKRQNTVETSTYRAEMAAGRLAVEQAMDVRYKLRMLGMPIVEATAMLGDNQSVITSGSIPSSNLKKKHNAIAYHRIREAVAAGVVKLKHIVSIILLMLSQKPYLAMSIMDYGRVIYSNPCKKKGSISIWEIMRTKRVFKMAKLYAV